MQDKFNFFVESSISDEIYKAASSNPTTKYDNMILDGTASTADEDSSGETLYPDGFDISEFLQNGLINLEHFTIRKGSPDFWIGHPIDASIKNNEFYIKAKLWKGNQHAEKLWDNLLVMKANNVPRALGWSIEGNKQVVDPNNKKKILKAKINHCALTFSPVNKNTFANIVKGGQGSDFVPLAYNKQETDGGEYLLVIEENDKIITIDKNFSVKIKPKSMTTDSIRPLIPEGKGRIPQWDSFIKAINEGMVKKDKIVEIFNKLNKKYPIN